MNSLRKAVVGAALAAAVLSPVPSYAGNEWGAAVGGFLLGTIVAQPRPVYRPAPVYIAPAPAPGVYVQPAPVYQQPGYVQPGYNAHQQWCLQRYRSYNPQSDTYLSTSGVYKYCNSPYN
jgi:hypothetical protein